MDKVETSHKLLLPQGPGAQIRSSGPDVPDEEALGPMCPVYLRIVEQISHNRNIIISDLEILESYLLLQIAGFRHIFHTSEELFG